MTDPNPREQTFGKNPYFKESTLTKKLTLTPPASLEPKPETPSPYDLEAPVYLGPKTPITWTSPDHDLTKKAPRANVEDKEEFDEFDGTGSFFNFFTDEGEDPTGMGEILLEWFGHATESVAFTSPSFSLPLSSVLEPSPPSTAVSSSNSALTL